MAKGSKRSKSFQRGRFSSPKSFEDDLLSDFDPVVAGRRAAIVFGPALEFRRRLDRLRTRFSPRSNVRRAVVRVVGPRTVRAVAEANFVRRLGVCVRRKVRREVLHAFGRTGRGSGGGPKRYSDDSRVRC